MLKYCPGQYFTLPAAYLCPVLQPLVELKYPVVSLVPVWRVPPVQRAQQAIRERDSDRVWRGPEHIQPLQGWQNLSNPPTSPSQPACWPC